MPKDCSILIIGAGPAGLMAAQCLAEAGYPSIIADSMPSPARKFLRAGIGGLNLTHSEAIESFVGRYGGQAERFAPWLHRFGPQQVVEWAEALGITCFTGSSGRVFPQGMKASPLLRLWLRHLAALGCQLNVRYRWLGWDESGACRFATADGEILLRPTLTLLALGGASWPHLGSDGQWTHLLGDSVRPFRPANCGFECQWSEHFRTRYAGQPLKPVVAATADGPMRKGEMLITRHGIEGSLIYALSAPLRNAIERDGQAMLQLDLKPDWSLSRLTEALSRPKGSRSFSHHLERTSHLHGVAAGLLREILGPDLSRMPAPQLAGQIKSLPLTLTATRPLAEAISSAGGLDFQAVDESLMLRSRPGTFVAGEMLDWEAPTGGYLLTGCFSTAHHAAQGMLRLLQPSHL